MMDIQQEAAYLRNAFPDIPWEERRERKNISLVCPNEANPRFPLMVTFTEHGAFLDLGKEAWVMEECLDSREVAELVGTILRDELLVTVAYRTRQGLEGGRGAYYSGSYDLNDEDDREDYEAFRRKIARPRTLWERLNPFSVAGYIEITNWSGSRREVVRRK